MAPAIWPTDSAPPPTPHPHPLSKVADASIAGGDAAATYVEEEDVLGDTVLAAGAAARAADNELAEVEPLSDEDSDSESESEPESG